MSGQSLTEQTSFYDIDQGQNHVKPLDVVLRHAKEEVLGLPNGFLDTHFLRMPTTTHQPLNLVPPSPADIEEVKQFGRIVNSPAQRKAMEVIADQPTPVIQSWHLRWTTEHAADVQSFAIHVPTVRPARHYGEL